MPAAYFLKIGTGSCLPFCCTSSFNNTLNRWELKRPIAVVLRVECWLQVEQTGLYYYVIYLAAYVASQNLYIWFSISGAFTNLQVTHAICSNEPPHHQMPTTVYWSEQARWSVWWFPKRIANFVMVVFLDLVYVPFLSNWYSFSLHLWMLQQTLFPHKGLWMCSLACAVISMIRSLWCLSLWVKDLSNPEWKPRIALWWWSRQSCRWILYLSSSFSKSLFSSYCCTLHTSSFTRIFLFYWFIYWATYFLALQESDTFYFRKTGKN